MSDWIASKDKLPEEHSRILVTIERHGKPAVVPCWFIENNRILFSDTPNAPTFSFSMVSAWQPFPQPYQA